MISHLSLFFINLPKSIKNLKSRSVYYFLSTQVLDVLEMVKKIFKKSIFFYCPHSPHVYANDLNKIFNEPINPDLSKRYFLLMGHPLDTASLQDNHEFSDSNLEKLFIGHPKYSDEWLHDLRMKARKFRSVITKDKQQTSLF